MRSEQAKKILIIDPDKVLVDIIFEKDYLKIPLSNKAKLETYLRTNNLLNRVRCMDAEFYVALRPGAREFLKELSEFYNIYLFSYIGRHLVEEIVDKILDPDGTIITRRDF